MIANRLSLRWLVATTLLAGALWVGPAMGNPITATSTAKGWFTTRQVAGNLGAANVGSTVTVTYPAGTVPASQTATVTANGSWAVYPPATVPPLTPATITSTVPGCGGPAPVIVADILNPPHNQAFAHDIILAGSTATAGGNTFALTGAYTLTATSIDYDPNSPSYGNLSGSILASDFSLTGSGPAGTISLALSGDQPYTVNMLPIFPPPNPNGDSISFSVPISGTVTFNGTTDSFTGSVSGTATYGDGGAETDAFALNLNSGFGAITGSVSASGVEVLTPEPSSLMLLGVGAFGALGYAWRQRRQDGGWPG